MDDMLVFHALLHWLFLFVVHRMEGAALFGALVVLVEPAADHPGLFHLHAEVLPDVVYRLKDRYEGASLVALGPPTCPILARDLEVMPWARLKGSSARGVEPEIIDTNMPLLMPAPQAPQLPQAPPGTWPPLIIMVSRAFLRSMSPPAFLYAVRSAAPTITWCSGPCMWQKGIDIIFLMIFTGSLDVSDMQRPRMGRVGEERDDRG